MCGIAGSIGSKNAEFLDRLAAVMQHRGPDDTGTWFDPSNHVALIHRRLSIIDLSEQAHQPMISSCGRFRIIFNGEIYNYVELRKNLVCVGRRLSTESDTEVILEGYAEWGSGFFSRLRGMFSFAIWDSVDGKLILCRDRLGIKPLYIYRNSDLLIFASELRVVAAHPSFKAAIRRSAISEYLTFGSVQEPGTIYEGVSALGPGTFVEFSSDLSVKHEGFYSLGDSISAPPLNIEYSEARQLVRTALEEASKYHLIADVEVGAFLSGGIDSTAVVALMQQQSKHPIKTFTVGFDSKCGVVDESNIAETVARAIGANHRRILVTASDFSRHFDGFISALDQPSADGLNTFIVSQAAAQEVKVCLSGLGGDEIFGGYPFYLNAMVSRRNNPYFRRLLEFLHSIYPNRFTIKGISAELSVGDRISFFRSGGGKCPENVEDSFSEKTLLQQISLLEINGYLRNTLLRDSDVMSMAHSLELRPVLLDHPLVELALSLPDEYKIGSGLLKRIFRESVQDLLPIEVLSLPKNGFVLPYVPWFNLNMRNRALDLDKSDGTNFLLDQGLLKHETRCKYRKRIQQGIANASDYRLFILLSWLDRKAETYG